MHRDPSVQEHGWDLRRALDTHFAALCAEAEQKERAEEEERNRAKVEKPKLTISKALEQGVLTTAAPTSLVFLTWNIDGLDQTNLRLRTKAVAKVVEEERADVVFLQEVLPTTFQYLQEKLPGYHCLAAKEVRGYFALPSDVT